MWTSPYVMPFCSADTTCIIPSRDSLIFTHNSWVYFSQLWTRSLVMPTLSTYPATVIPMNRVLSVIWFWSWTCSSVVPFFPTQPTSESSVSYFVLNFWTIVSPVTLKSTISAVKFYTSHCFASLATIFWIRKVAFHGIGSPLPSIRSTLSFLLRGSRETKCAAEYYERETWQKQIRRQAEILTEWITITT